MKLYTRTGDDGTTGLFGGERVLKSDPRVVAYGEVDELNAAIGCALSICTHRSIHDKLTAIQRDLFTIGAELSSPGGSRVQVDSGMSARLEGWIDEASEAVPELRNFILPGGTPLGAQLHFARAVCRRAERAVVAFDHDKGNYTSILVYLNRLSDLLFALARFENHLSRIQETPWIPRG